MQRRRNATQPTPARCLPMPISIHRWLIVLMATTAPIAATAQTDAPAVKPAAPGVLVPQTDPDPGILVKPPASALPMPVIPPPGAAGNASPVQPK